MEQQMKAVHGRNKVLFFRDLAKAKTEPAKKLVFQTEHTFSYSNDTESIMTKDGAVISSKGVQTEVSINAIQAAGDPVIGFLRDAVLNSTKLELWEVTVDEGSEDAQGKYPAIYCQGYLNEWEDPAGVEDFVEVSSTFVVEQKPQWGRLALTAEQTQAVQYAFRDLATYVEHVPAG